MKYHLRFTISLMLLTSYSSMGQTVDFPKIPTEFTRKPNVQSANLKLTAFGINSAFPITVTLQNSGEIKFTPNPITISVSTNGDIQVPLIVPDDTTEKNTQAYSVLLTYNPPGGTAQSKYHTILMKPFKSDLEEPTLQKNDFLLFAGSNFDPANERSTLTSFSFEGIFKFDLAKNLHMRVGGYSNRNFSVDSATALPQIRYINTTPDKPLKVGESLIAVQTFSLDNRSTTRSAGIYGELFFAFLNKKATRISLATHFEYVRRNVVPTISVVGSVIRDTIVYTQELAERRVVVGNNLTSNANIFAPRRYIDQYYMTIGVAIERTTSVFDLFIQPFIGMVISNTRLSSRSALISERYPTLGIRGQATVKLLDVTVAIDLRDINTARPFTNVSIGIPVSAKSLTEKLKKL